MTGGGEDGDFETGQGRLPMARSWEHLISMIHERLEHGVSRILIQDKQEMYNHPQTSRDMMNIFLGLFIMSVSSGGGTVGHLGLSCQAFHDVIWSGPRGEERRSLLEGLS